MNIYVLTLKLEIKSTYYKQSFRYSKNLGTNEKLSLMELENKIT